MQGFKSRFRILETRSNDDNGDHGHTDSSSGWGVGNHARRGTPNIIVKVYGSRSRISCSGLLWYRLCQVLQDLLLCTMARFEVVAAAIIAKML